MPLVSGIQAFLEQLHLSQLELAKINYKINPLDVRQFFSKIAHQYITDYDRELVAVDRTLTAKDGYLIPFRIYNPDPAQKLPVAVFLHGGGHMCGSIEDYDGIARKLAVSCHMIIVVIGYRLAPEFPYPYGLNDCKQVILNLFNVLDGLQVKHIAYDLTLIGDSAGAALSASIVLNQELVAKAQITRQVLIYPSLDYTLQSATVDQFGSGYFLEKSRIIWYFDNYFQKHEQRKHVSPLYGEFHANFPNTLVIVPEYDPLHGEGVAYHNKLIQAGGCAQLVIVDKVIHAFLLLENLCPEECAFTYQTIAQFVKASIPITDCY